MKQYRDLSRLNIDRHAKEEDEEPEDFYKDVMSPVQKPRTIDEIKEEEKSDTFAFIMLGFLYFVQGLPLGFFDNSLTFIFTEKGASFTDLSKLSLIMYPYSIKFLFAPLEDSVYFPFFGKRKSYIVPALVIAGTGLLIVSFYIEGLINNMQIDLLVVIGLIFVSLMALQDIAVDGWIVTLISPRNYSVAAAFQKIMVSIGYFTAFNLFIPLNSVDFCNKYLYSTPSDTPLLTFDGFCIGAGVLTLSVGLSLAFYKEKAPREEHIVTFTEVYYMFRKLVLNKFLRRFVILLLLSHVNLRPVTGIFEPLMIQKGFKKEDLTNIKTVVVPFQILSIIYAAYLNKKQRNELFLFSFSTLILTFVNIFAFWILNSYDSLSYAKLSLLLGFQECLWGGLAWFANGSLSAYILNVTHESAASTFITTMYSINNFSGKWPETIALAIREVVSSNAIIIFSFVFGIIYAPLLFKYFVPLQKKTAFDFGFHKETLQSPPRSREDSFNFETHSQVNIKYQPIPS